MKKIYAFELDDDYASGEVKSDVSIIAYLLYCEIKELEDYNGVKILATDNFLEENELLDLVYTEYGFRDIYRASYFKHEDDIMFEPFIFDGLCFGITVNEGAITAGVMQGMLGDILRTLNKKYDFDISFVRYETSNIKSRELRHRWDAISSLFEPPRKEQFKPSRKVFKKNRILPTLKKRPI